MKKIGKFAAALVLMAAAIGMMGCSQPSGGGSSTSSGSNTQSSSGGSSTSSGSTSGVHEHTWKLTADTATYVAAGEGTYTCTCGQTKTEATAMKAPAYQFTESVVALTGDDNTGTNGTNSNYVLFGDWPQSEAAAEITYRTEPESNGYYVGSDGNYYVKVTVENTKNEYTAGDVKYFKVEPIKWRVLDTAFDYDGETGSNTAKLLLAENILTANVPYYESTSNHRNGKYANNYEHSQIRAYLNGISYNSVNSDADSEKKWLSKGFLQTAFTATAQAEIKTTVVDNTADSTTNYDTSNGTITKATTYACDNTNDKIFLLSEYEVTKYSPEAYNAYGAGNSRIRKTTPYARANNASQSSTNGYGGYWWLRSPYYTSSDLARNVSDVGDAVDHDGVYFSDDGVVPALSIAF